MVIAVSIFIYFLLVFFCNRIFFFTLLLSNIKLVFCSFSVGSFIIFSSHSRGLQYSIHFFWASEHPAPASHPSSHRSQMQSSFSPSARCPGRCPLGLQEHQQHP